MSEKAAPPDLAGRGDLLAAFQQSYGELRRFLMRLTGSRERAEDLAHDVYLRLKAAETGVVTDGRAYIFKVAANLVADQLRSIRRRGPHEAVDDFAERIADPEPDAERVGLARERLRLVDKALMELPEPVRRALLMNRVEGLGHAEIAKRLGVSESTVAKHIARALLHCRRRLDRPHFPLPPSRRETS